MQAYHFFFLILQNVYKDRAKAFMGKHTWKAYTCNEECVFPKRLQLCPPMRGQSIVQ